MYIHIDIYICVHAYIHIYKYMYIYIYIFAFVYVYACMHTYTTNAHMHAYTHTHPHTHTRTNTHAHIQTRNCTCIHVQLRVKNTKKSNTHTEPVIYLCICLYTYPKRVCKNTGVSCGLHTAVKLIYIHTLALASKYMCVYVCTAWASTFICIYTRCLGFHIHMYVHPLRGIFIYMCICPVPGHPHTHIYIYKPSYGCPEQASGFTCRCQRLLFSSCMCVLLCTCARAKTYICVSFSRDVFSRTLAHSVHTRNTPAILGGGPFSLRKLRMSYRIYIHT